MLEFIVLGQIPGTSVQISFNWVLIIAASLLSFVEMRKIYFRAKHETSDETTVFDDIAL